MVDYREDYQRTHRPTRDAWADTGGSSYGVWIAGAVIIAVVLLALMFGAGSSGTTTVDPTIAPQTGMPANPANPAAPAVVPDPAAPATGAPAAPAN